MCAASAIADLSRSDAEADAVTDEEEEEEEEEDMCVDAEEEADSEDDDEEFAADDNVVESDTDALPPNGAKVGATAVSLPTSDLMEANTDSSERSAECSTSFGRAT